MARFRVLLIGLGIREKVPLTWENVCCTRHSVHVRKAPFRCKDCRRPTTPNGMGSLRSLCRLNRARHPRRMDMHQGEVSAWVSFQVPPLPGCRVDGQRPRCAGGSPPGSSQVEFQLSRGFRVRTLLK